jgi:hypothetical protein
MSTLFQQAKHKVNKKRGEALVRQEQIRSAPKRILENIISLEELEPEFRDYLARLPKAPETIFEESSSRRLSKALASIGKGKVTKEKENAWIIASFSFSEPGVSRMSGRAIMREVGLYVVLIQEGRKWKGVRLYEARRLKGSLSWSSSDMESIEGHSRILSGILRLAGKHSQMLQELFKHQS